MPRKKKQIQRKPFWQRSIETTLNSLKKLLVPALCLWLVTWLYLGGVFSKTAEMTWGGFVDWTATQGFVVSDVMINGRDRTDTVALKNAIAVKPNDPLLAVDLDRIHRAVTSLKWVRDAQIARSYNGLVTVTLAERIPFIIWDRPGVSAVVVDREGEIIKGVKASDYRDLLIVRGVDAPDHAPQLMQMILAEPTIATNTRAAEWIGGRRWDLITTGNIKISLPADDIGFALSRLAKAIDQQRLLDKPLLSIDLRAKDRIIIETKRGESQDLMTLSSTAETNAI